MSFKKNKIISEVSHWSLFKEVSNLSHQYATLKKRNLVSGFFLGIAGLLFVTAVSFATFDHLPNFRFDFSFLSSLGGSNLFEKVAGTEEGKINILLTGIGGGVHEGADLTDTIILASLNNTSKTVSLLSIPRDLYVGFPNSWAGKINELYLRGSKTVTSSGQDAMQLLKDKVREITGENIDYSVTLDFDGFVKFIDLLGGVDINVPEDLTDNEYPAGEDLAYTTFSIKKGQQTLDGATALKYARSRHSTSDFDRSIRQQLVIKAVKEKLLSLNYITSPSKMKALYYAISSHVITDLSLGQIASIAFFAKDLPTDHILSFNLNDSCFQWLAYCERGGFLYTPQRELFGGASVLLPDGATPGNLSSYTDTRKFANLVFNYPEMFLENQEVNIVNSTKASGIAAKVAITLKQFGFNVPDKDSIYSTKDDYPKTQVLYPWDEVNKLGIDPKSKTLEALSLFFFSPQIPVAKNQYSKWASPNIEIVLGKDYKLFFNQ